jgi:hypothetical protein
MDLSLDVGFVVQAFVTALQKLGGGIPSPERFEGVKVAVVPLGSPCSRDRDRSVR